MVFRWSVAIFGGLYDVSTTIWPTAGLRACTGTPLADRTGRGRSSVVFNQSSMGR